MLKSRSKAQIVRFHATAANKISVKKVSDILDKLTISPTKRNRKDLKNSVYSKYFTPIDLRSPRRANYQFHRHESLLFDQKYKNTILEEHINSYESNYTSLSVPNHSTLPKLEHKLSRVLFSPGVHYLQDPRSQVYNFDPYLSNILPIDQFDFDSITKYVTSSKDETLAQVAKENKSKFYSSTSSMTGVLSHFHYLLSNFRPQSLLEFTKYIPYGYGSFTKGAKLPASVIVRKNGEFYSIDSEKSTDREMILSLLGHSLERMLTLTEEEFKKYIIDDENQSKSIRERENNVYHYAKLENFIMRSQLDCQDKRLPGNGTFDLKTRAVSAVRHDIAKVERDSTSYQIVKNFGNYESFEREHYDLVKSTLLKYGLQARIGDMDGIFVAYHNTVRMFGFEYLPLSKIDEILHSFGLPDFQEDFQEGFENDDIIDLRSELSSKLANDEFKLSMNLWNKILKQIIKEIPNSSFRFITKAIPVSDFETILKVIASPIEQDEIDSLQDIGKKIRSELISVINDDKENLIEEKIDKRLSSINEINKKLCKGVIGFNVHIKNYIDDQESLYRHPVYNNLDSSWRVKFKFVKLQENESIKYYDSFLNERTEMISNDTIKKDDEVNDFIKILRHFSERGKKILNNKNSTIVWNDE